MGTKLNNTRVLVVSNEQVGVRMAGPAIRALNIAHQLYKQGAKVTLATPDHISTDTNNSLLDGLECVTFGMPSVKRFTQLSRAHDVVFTQPQRLDIAHALSRIDTPIIYDLYVPSFVERAAQLAGEDFNDELRAMLLERDRLEYSAAIRLGSAFVCASERQKDHWLGALGQAGRISLELASKDILGEALMGVVPFGLSSTPAQKLLAGEGAIRGKLVTEDSVVFLWTGGLWNWFDPVIVVEALAMARKKDSRLRLVVMGAKHPESLQQPQSVSVRMYDRAKELNLLEGGMSAGVVFCDTWVPYEQRGSYLLDADAGVCAHHDSLETRLSFRTRLLDHIWANLPTITTKGGEVTDIMLKSGAALGVDSGDLLGWENALLEIAKKRDAGELDVMRRASASLASGLSWEAVTEPLLHCVEEVVKNGAITPIRPLSGSERGQYVRLLLRIRAKAKGFKSVASAVRSARNGKR